MKLGQGSRRRSPWWCWVVMVLAAVAVLPGAACDPGEAKCEPSDSKPQPVLTPDQAVRGPLPPAARATPPRDGKQVLIEFLCLSVSPEQAEQIKRTDFASIDPNDVNAVIARIKKDPPIKILAQPTLVTFDGRPASMRVGGQKQFIVGYKDGEPQTKDVFYGTRVDLLPILKPDGKVLVEFRLAVSNIRKGRTLQGKDSSTGKTVQIELPDVLTRELETGVEMRLDQTAVFGGLMHAAGPEPPQATVVMVRATLPGNSAP